MNWFSLHKRKLIFFIVFFLICGSSSIWMSFLFLEVGFKDYSTFYRAFLKMEKISPKEFARFTHPQNDEPTSISLE